MALSAFDHLLMGHAQRQHERFLENLTLTQSGLLERLADKTAGHKAYEALMDAVMDAYNSKDFDTLHALMTDREARKRVYRPVYDREYQSCMAQL